MLIEDKLNWKTAVFNIDERQRIIGERNTN